MITFTGIVCHRHIAVVINKVIQKKSYHDCGQRTGNTVGGACKSADSALCSASDHETVAYLAADCASHQKQHSGGAAHA